MKFWKNRKNLWTDLWQWFPPGYEFLWERNVAALFLALPAVLSLQYFGKLGEAVDVLYYVDRIRGRTLRPEAVATPFLALAGGYAVAFLPYFLFLAVMVLRHYSYYYQDTKSIYLMRRLPGKRVLASSCFRAPLFGMAVGILAEAALGLIYYGIYLLAMPAECMPGLL